jgi:predicted RNA-binding Zn-ribbon protein involved in translation (DUF1610 family)
MAKDPRLEECANCGRTIGRLETACVFKDQTVCADCYARLKPTIDYAAPVATGHTPPSVLPALEHALIDRRPATIQTSRACPACGSTLPAVKKSKGSSVLLIILLLLWILPGLIYVIFYNGYVYVCPRCGYKYGDAT